MGDLEKAAAQAEKENKDLFIVYRGGAWNPEAYGVPERQIFQICMAGRHLKKELSAGLEMLKSARGMAPWSKHANKAHTDFLRIPGNRDTLHRLWKQYKNGAEEAGTAYRKGILLNPDPVPMELKLQ